MDCYPIVLLILRSSNVMGTSALWEEMLKKTHKELGHLLIYLLLCSNHLHALHCLFCSYAITFWAAAPKGMKSCRTQGESVCPSICLSVLLSAFLSRMPWYLNSHLMTWRNDKRQYMDNGTPALIQSFVGSVKGEGQDLGHWGHNLGVSLSDQSLGLRG